ncbi:unnamed protein product [Allacma fusca]|uniref:Uncharacterized protein n=1 Tax=Allacma fusca TaxID=39272 RepID=A0A8J2PCJ9_9HEXA|nr:unnamed protein product [Allacma fusca]
MNFRNTIFFAILEVLVMLFVSAAGAENENSQNWPAQIEQPVMEQTYNITDEEKQYLLCFGRPCHRFSNSGDTCCQGFRCMAHGHFGGICIRGQPYDETTSTVRTTTTRRTTTRRPRPPN